VCPVSGQALIQATAPDSTNVWSLVAQASETKESLLNFPSDPKHVWMPPSSNATRNLMNTNNSFKVFKVFTAHIAYSQLSLVNGLSSRSDQHQNHRWTKYPENCLIQAIPRYPRNDWSSVVRAYRNQEPALNTPCDGIDASIQPSGTATGNFTNRLNCQIVHKDRSNN
jgi:hypothetical protein